jgi:hypothetical protein
MRGTEEGGRKEIGPNSKPKKTKGTCRKKTHYEERESDLPTDIDINEPYEGDVADDGGYFNDQDVCMICEEYGRDGELWYLCIWCSLWTHSAAVRIHLRATVASLVQRGRDGKTSR